MKKKMIVIISAVVVFVFAAGVSMLATFFPYKGKDSVLYWTPDMEYSDVSHAVRILRLSNLPIFNLTMMSRQ